ncbi:hypothetical protein TNCV_2228781 [Trichonephila clavipes]|nr:hypothetical protein TNCV_2228781 [Trichonephila clavipes]
MAYLFFHMQSENGVFSDKTELKEIESLRKQVELLNRPPQIDPSIAAVLSTLIETQTIAGYYKQIKM